MKKKKILAVCAIFCMLCNGAYAEADKNALTDNINETVYSENAETVLLSTGGGGGRGSSSGGSYGSAVSTSYPVISPSYNVNVITFKVQTDGEPGEYASVRVLKEGDESVASNAYAIEEIVVSEDKSITVSFEMPETRNEKITDGVYNLYIKLLGKSTDVYKFTFVTTATRDEAVELLAEADAAGVVTLLDEDSDYREALIAEGFDFDMYDSLSDSDKESVAADFASGSDKSSLMLKTIIGVTAIEDADVEDVLVMVNPVYDGVAFNDIEDKELKDFIIKYIDSVKDDITVKNITDEYAVANVLYKLNNAKYNEIDGLMKDNEDLLGLDGTDYNDYKKLSSSKKTGVCEKIVRKLKSSPVESAEAFINVLEDSMPTENSSSGGGGGSSSGGSSNKTVASGNSSNAIVTTLTPVEPEIVKAEEVFDDMENAQWAVPAVEVLYSKGIVSGVGDKSFAPMSNVTREAFITMIVKAMEIETNNDKGIFEDVVEGSWYAPYVNAAYREKISMGISDTEFGVGKLLTRQDMMTMISRLIDDTDVHARSISELTDFDEVSEYAKASVKNLYERGFVSGKGGNRIAPKDYTTRAEAAQMIYMMLEELEK